jgi:cardiolipin synthase
MGEKKISARKLNKIVSNLYGPLEAFSVGNKFLPLLTSEDIYKEFYSAISNAKKTINMEFFIFQADKTGMNFANLLCKKAKEGIKVNVILDFFGSYPNRDRSTAYKKMTDAGINLRFCLSAYDFFRSLFKREKALKRWRIKSIFKRNHRKILIVDGETAYTGGANIGKEYFWSKKTNNNSWHDFQFKINGPAVNLLQFEFFRTWKSDGGKMNLEDLDLYFKKQTVYQNGIALHILTNSFGKFNKLLKPIVNAINNAKEYIYIENPYILNRKIIRALCKARKRGVRIVVLTSLEKLDFNFLKTFIERSLMHMVKSNIEVYIYPKTLLHGKAMLIDDRIGIVGTANLNNRSFYLDYELNVEIFDRKTLLKLKKDLFEKDILISEKFTRTKGKFFSKLKYYFIHFLEKFS